jgi:Protein of unknown function (DUF4199)
MKSMTTFFGHPLLRIPLLAGGITGLLAILYFLVLYGFHGQSVLYVRSMRPLDFGFYLIGMGATVWYYRKYVNRGMLHLWEGITICYILYTVAALLTAWFIYGFVTLFEPTTFTQYITDLKTFQIRDKANYVKQFSEEAFNAQLAKTEATEPGDLIWDELLKKAMMTIFPALIISLIFRKQDYSIINP